MAVQLGPNHPDYARPLEPLPYPNDRRAVRRRARSAPAPVEIPEAADYTPSKLLRAFGRDHDARLGRPCLCPLCARLKVLVAEARGGSRGR